MSKVSQAQQTKKESEFRKYYAILRDIIKVYYKPDLDLDDPMEYNIPRMVERAMAKIGGYLYVDEAHCDFLDGSDGKTATITRNPQKKTNPNFHTLTITNTISQGGTVKGDLRVVVYNDVTEQLEYFFIPKSDIRALSRIPKKGMPRIEVTYNSKTGLVPKLEKYRMPDFVSLCKQPSTCMEIEVTLDPCLLMMPTMENANVCVN
jgi:hypothetical protein